MFKLLATYSSYRFKYRFRQKYEGFTGYIFNKRVFNPKYIFHFIITKYIVNVILFFVLGCFINNQLVKNIGYQDTVITITSILFIFNLINGINVSHSVIDPFDKQLLFLSSLSNKQIFFLNWISNFVVNTLPQVIYTIILGLSTIFFLPDNYRINYLMTLIIIFLIAILFSFFISTLLINAKSELKVKGIGIFSFIKSCLVGLTLSVVAFQVGKIFIRILEYLFEIIDTPSGFLSNIKNLTNIISQNLPSDILLSFLSTVNLTNYNWTHYLFPRPFSELLLIGNGVSRNDLILFIYSLLILIFLVLCTKNNGFWYKKNNIPTSNNKWLQIYRRIVLTNEKNKIVKGEINSLFNDSEVVYSRYRFFLGYHFWLYAGFSIALIHMTPVREIKDFASFIIIYSLTKSCINSPVSIFPSKFKFDGNVTSVYLYRLVGESFVKLLKNKIKVIRRIVIFELTISLFIVLTILRPDFYTIVIFLVVTFLNVILVPYFSISPSYINLHLRKQHFTDADVSVSQNLIEDKIIGRIEGWFFLILSLIYLMLFKLSINGEHILFPIIVTGWFCSIYFITLCCIQGFVNKNALRLERKDLL